MNVRASSIPALSALAFIALSFAGSFLRADEGPASTTVATPAESCTASTFREFDFWIGEWDVVDAEGKPAGRNRVRAEDNGCVVVEEWTSARGNTGRSLNFYDPRTRSWRQNWVGLGILLEMSGGLQPEGMVLEGPLYYLEDGRTTRLRGVWTKLPDGRVRQHFTESADGGRTWSEWFDGYYTMRTPSSARKK